MLKKIVAGAVIVTMTGCYGSFNAVQGVHKYNGEVSSNKFAQEAVFIILNIIPVYGVAALLDALIFNTIEFWSGENPLANAGETQRVDGKDGSYVMSEIKRDGTMDITVVESSGKRHFVNMKREGDKIVARDIGGAVIATRSMNEVQQLALAQ